MSLSFEHSTRPDCMLCDLAVGFFLNLATPPPLSYWQLSDFFVKHEQKMSEDFWAESLIIDDEDNPDGYHGSYPQNQNMVDMNRLPFSDFLRDVLYDQQQQQQQQMDSQKMAEAQGLAVLDFCDDANLEMNDLDFGMLDNWNIGNVHGMLATDPNLANYVSQPEDTADMSRMRQRLVKIWTNSPWRWMPDGHKDNIHNQKSGLPLADINSTQLKPDRIIHDKLDSSGRDKILAIVLSTCQNNVMLSRVASSFPSTDVMDSLVHIFLAWHLCQVSEFIHFGTFALNAQCPEWTAVAASAGGILTSVQSLRKFGFALQEAVRKEIDDTLCAQVWSANELVRCYYP